MLKAHRIEVCGYVNNERHPNRGQVVEGHARVASAVSVTRLPIAASERASALHGRCGSPIVSAMRNRLNEETSPYLLQHADNPVHWQAWSEEALAAARAAGQADPAVGRLLGVPLVPRDGARVVRGRGDRAAHERPVREHQGRSRGAPDLDKIYQTAHQLYTGRAGGWPLTVFLTPDGQMPIFTGTYFPKERRYGMPAFREVLVAIENYYRKQGAEIRERGAGLVDAFDEIATGSADDFAELSRAPLEQRARAARRELRRRARRLRRRAEVSAPDDTSSCCSRTGSARSRRHRKAATARRRRAAQPHPRRAAHRRRRDALAMVTHTLDRMALARPLRSARRRLLPLQRGPPLVDPALREDALRQRGAARASTPTRSRRPARRSTRRVASATADWVIRDMQDARGAFYSTLDADSEHEEGKFYVWTPAEFDALLTPDESRAREARVRARRAARTSKAKHLAPVPARRRPTRPPPRSASTARTRPRCSRARA